MSKPPMLSAGRPSANRKEEALAKMSDQKQPLIRINFDIERDKHTKLKVMAAQQQRTIADILRQAVDDLTK